MMMEKYLRNKGLFKDYVNKGAQEILNIQADILRRDFKVVDPL